MSKKARKRCSRCAAQMVGLWTIGHYRLRCPAEACERRRRDRRAGQAASARAIRFGPEQRPAARRSVAELLHHFWEPGQPGYEAALEEARELVASGMTVEEVAAEDMIGLPVEELRAALGLVAPVVADPPAADRRSDVTDGEDQRAAA
jgi:hypothetical protein